MRIVVAVICAVLLAGCFGVKQNSPKNNGPVIRPIRLGTPDTSDLYPTVRPLLEIDDDNFVQTVCTCTLLGPRTALTAAHCLDDVQGTLVVGGAGFDVWGDISEFIVVTGYRVHPEYDPLILDTPDVAVIELAGDGFPGLNYRSLYQGAALTQGQNVPAVGFGWDGRGSDGDGDLGKKLYGTFSFSGAVDAIGLSGAVFPNAVSLFVAGPSNQLSCLGDSGGPYLVDGQIAGVSSYGTFETDDFFCTEGTESGYTTVSPFVDWILNTDHTPSPSPGPSGAQPDDCVIDDILISADGGCKDQRTDSVWSAQVMRTNSNDTFTWQDAHNYCENSDQGGKTDWRLPASSELTQFIALSGKVHVRLTAMAAQGSFWTDDTSPFATAKVIVNFVTGLVEIHDKNLGRFVLCVR